MSDENSGVMSDEERKALETVIALGGKDVVVRYRDAAKGPETVRVRVLDNVIELQKFFLLLEREAEFAEFVTGRPANWGESLTIESLIDICDAGQTINFPRALRFAERRRRATETVAGVIPNAATRRVLDDFAPASAASSTARRAR